MLVKALLFLWLGAGFSTFTCMDPIFKKLNFKGEAEILVLQSPDSFTANLDAIRPLTTIIQSPDQVSSLDFALAFVIQQTEIDELAPLLALKKGLPWKATP